MAKIIENETGRRTIKMSPDDVISVVKEYQRLVQTPKSYEKTREILINTNIYLPEEV